MKRLFTIIVLLLLSNLLNAQTGCSCSSGGNSCSTECNKDSIANCTGANGQCICSCTPKPPEPSQPNHSYFVSRYQSNIFRGEECDNALINNLKKLGWITEREQSTKLSIPKN